MHYFLLVAFMWMFFEAYFMYFAFVKVWNDHGDYILWKCASIAWGELLGICLIHYLAISFVYWLVGLCDQFVHLFVHSLNQSVIHPFIQSTTHAFIYSFNQLSIISFIHLSINLFIHPYIHSSHSVFLSYLPRLNLYYVNHFNPHLFVLRSSCCGSNCNYCGRCRQLWRTALVCTHLYFICPLTTYKLYVHDSF